MIFGIIIGYHKAYDLTTGVIETIYSATNNLQLTLKDLLIQLLSQEKPILLGSIFTASVISYDLILFYQWLTSFKFTRSRHCKKCNHKLIREQRVFMDRALSSLLPLKRYRCIGCGQEYLIVDHLDKKNSATSGTEMEKVKVPSRHSH